MGCGCAGWGVVDGDCCCCGAGCCWGCVADWLLLLVASLDWVGFCGCD